MIRNLNLIDPFFNNGSSPPSWTLGTLEREALASGWTVSVCDFMSTEKFQSAEQFDQREAEFLQAVVEASTTASLVYITTSRGIPQKPHPVLRRVCRLVHALVSAGISSDRIWVGGAQVRSARLEGIKVDQLLHLHQRQVLDDDLAMRSVLRSFLKVGQRALPAGLESRVSGPLWSSWDLTRYPHYVIALSSLGCRYGCTFCFESKQEFSKLDLNETFTSVRDAGFSAFALEDSTIIGAHGGSGLLRYLQSQNTTGTYSAYALVSEVSHASDELLMAFSDHGLSSMILGIETPDAAMMATYRKRVRPDRVHEALYRLKNADVRAQGCLMVALPEQTMTDIEDSIDYALGLDLELRRWHIFQPQISETFISWRREVDDPVQFALSPVDVPDSILPEVLDKAQCVTMLEEHAVIRALPYLSEPPRATEDVRYPAGHSLRDVVDILLDRVRGTQSSFNEEDFYRTLSGETFLSDSESIV